MQQNSSFDIIPHNLQKFEAVASLFTSFLQIGHFMKIIFSIPEVALKQHIELLVKLVSRLSLLGVSSLNFYGIILHTVFDVGSVLCSSLHFHTSLPRVHKGRLEMLR